MEEKDIVNTTAEELSSAKPDYEKEIASIIRSNASPAQIKDKLLDYHENDIAAALDSMSISERQRLYARTAADQRNDIELCKAIKRHLISQMPLVIIYLESESDVSPICPQLEN